MPRLTKFQEEWLSLKDSTGKEIKLWCKEGKDEYHCFCSFCRKQIAVGNSGKLQLLQHALTAKHKKSAFIDPCQVKLTATISTLTGEKGLCLPPKSLSSTSSWNYSEEEKIISSEILYTLYAAVNNISFSACDGVSKLLSRMFPECKAVKDMKLSARKMSYEISHGLGPYFLSKVSKAVENCSYYTLMFDESLNEGNLKQLDVHVQFWNIKTNAIQHSYIGSELLKHATATDIDSAIMNTLEKAKIPLKKLIMLGSDGPNVNKAVFKIIDQRVKSVSEGGLINVGTCNLHIMHNAFGKGLKIEAFGSITELLEDIDIWFKKYPSRQEDLLMTANNSDEEDDVCNTTLRYLSNRWLSIVPACNRIIQMYKTLEKHFLKDLVEKKSPLLKNERYKRISNGLNSPLTLAYLNFLVSVGTVFEKFLKFLQSDTPLIHMLYDEMLGVVKKLLNRFISGMAEFPNDEDIIDIPLRKVMDKEKLKHLDVGSEARKVLSSVDNTEKHCFRLNAQEFYFTVTSYLLEKLPFKNVLLKSIQVLHPLARKEPATKTTPVMKKLVQILSRCIQKGECDKIIDEWKIYTVDDDIKEEWSQVQSGDCIKWAPVDEYWGKVLSLNSTSLEKKYFHLSKIVKVALCLSHGQALVERGFSINKRMMSDRAKMSLASIIGLRLVKDNVKKDDVSETVINKEMITFYKEAHGKYKADLLLNQPKKPEKPKESVKLPTPQEKLSNLKKDVSNAHKLIEEGNNRLAAALKRKSFDDIAAAQALIAAGNKKLKSSQ